MVTMDKVAEGKGRSKRTRYRSTVTFHVADEQGTFGLNHFRPIHSSGPRDSKNAKQALIGATMADF